MLPSRWHRLVRFAGVALAFAGALWQLSLLGRLFVGRFRYPWDVEWLEIGALYQAHRVEQEIHTHAPQGSSSAPRR